MEDLKVLIEKVESRKKQLGIYYEPIMLLVKNGLRVSELLNIESSDIMSSGYIIIRGSKGSSSRLVSVDVKNSFWSAFRNYENKISDQLSRFQVRRIMQKIGIDAKKEGNKNNSQTSLARNAYVQMLNQTTLTDREKANQTGHKSINNLKYYGRKTK